MPETRKKRAREASLGAEQPFTHDGEAVSVGTPSLAKRQRSRSSHSGENQGAEKQDAKNTNCAAGGGGHSFQGVTMSDQSRSHLGNVYGNVTWNVGAPIPLPGDEIQKYLEEKRRLAEAEKLEQEQQLEEERQLRKKRDHFVKALGFDVMQSRLATIRPAHADTCRWIVQTPEYARWRDEEHRNDHHGVLWIKGKPGSGKSTLLKYALNVANESEAGETIVSFFFNARGQLLERTTEGMYRSLLYQLLSALPYLYASQIHIHQQNWPVDMLENAFRMTILSVKPDQHIFCYIDALDECTQDEVRDAVALFEDLSEVAVTRGVRFSICFSSRHYPKITMHKNEEIKLDRQSGHLQDISKYVQSSLSRLRIAPPFKDDIVANIVGRCSGIFLWVVLVIKILREKHDSGASNEELVASLKKLPQELGQLFAEILKEADDDTILAFRWVLYARRPLGAAELYFAIKASSGKLSTGEWNQLDVDADGIRRFLLSCTRGLVEVTIRPWYSKEQICLSSHKADYIPFTDRTQFIHESVREHLISGGLPALTSGDQSSLKASSHALLAQWSLSYLRLDDSRYLHSDEWAPESYQVFRVIFPLSTYATFDVLEHVERAYIGGAFDLERLEEFPLKLLIRIRQLFRGIGAQEMTVSTPTTTLCYLLLERRCLVLASALLARRAALRNTLTSSFPRCDRAVEHYV